MKSTMRTALVAGMRGVWWYLREVSGETAYEQHVTRHRDEHPDHPPPTRREFERARQNLADARPGPQRCC